MRAAQIQTLTGPADIVVADLPEPTPGEQDVLIEVHRVGVSFPDLLLSRGEYQIKPDVPFAPGVDVAGTVISGPASSRASGWQASVASAAAPSGPSCRRCSPSPCPTTSASTRARRCR